MTVRLNSPDAFFSEFLGLELSAIPAGRCVVVPHAGLANYAGAWLFLRGSSAVISVPAALVDETAARAQALRAQDLHDSAAALFGERIERAIGPVFLGWLEPSRFRRPEPRREVRALAADDRPALVRLAEACGPNDWEASAIDPGEPGLVGAFAGGELVAAAKVRAWQAKVGDLGVATHPAHRARGHASAAAAEIIARHLTDDWLLLYQTLDANTASLALARRLGFERYATNLALRLRAGK